MKTTYAFGSKLPTIGESGGGRASGERMFTAVKSSIIFVLHFILFRSREEIKMSILLVKKTICIVSSNFFSSLKTYGSKVLFALIRMLSRLLVWCGRVLPVCLSNLYYYNFNETAKYWFVPLRICIPYSTIGRF
jgi:hypothetical protein